MGAKKTVTAQTSSNKEILRTSQAKKGLADSIYKPAASHALKSAQRDDSGLYRGRASADAAQAFSKPVMQSMSKTASTGRGLSSVGRVLSAQDAGTASALSEGKKRGVYSRDTNVANMINLGIGQQAQSSRAMSALSQSEFKRMQASAEIAANETNQVRGAVTGLATMGIGKAMQPGNEAISKENESRYLDAQEAHPDKYSSFDDWGQNSGSAKQPTWGRSFLSALGGAG